MSSVVWRPVLVEDSVDSYTGEPLVAGMTVHVCTKCRRVVTDATHKEVSPKGKCFGCEGETVTVTVP
jgi:hypothetical protein